MSKLKYWLEMHKPGTVCLASWLVDHGISHSLQKRYRKSGWIESIGTGAFKKPGEKLRWQGALYALQTQAKLPIHVGGLTALTLQGYSHYVRFDREPIFLFLPTDTVVPAWFRNQAWAHPMKYVRTSMLSSALGLTDHDQYTYAIRISSPERAMLECLYTAPRDVDLVECFQVMEGLANLRPKVVQQLLEACTSIKAKRLFLYMAEKAGHRWLSRIDVSRVDLGSGDRSLATGGVYVPKYGLVMPKSLAAV